MRKFNFRLATSVLTCRLHSGPFVCIEIGLNEFKTKRKRPARKQQQPTHRIEQGTSNCRIESSAAAPLQQGQTRTTTDHALVLRHCLRGGRLLAINSVLPFLCSAWCLHRRIYLPVRIIQVAQFLNVTFPPVAFLPAHKLVGAKSLVVGSAAVLLRTRPETSIRGGGTSAARGGCFGLRTQ